MKIVKKLINFLTTLIIVVGVVFIGFYLFGLRPYVVLSGSMEPKIQTGSLSFINKNVKYKTIKEKDVIAFKLTDGTLVTHRVIGISNEGIQTQGDANDYPDGTLVTEKNYVGYNAFSIPKIGYAVRVVQTTKGKIIFGTLVGVLFLAGVLIGEPDKKKQQQPVLPDNYPQFMN